MSGPLRPARLARLVVPAFAIAVAAVLLTVVLALAPWRAGGSDAAVDFLALYAGGRLASEDRRSIYDVERQRTIEAEVLQRSGGEGQTSILAPEDMLPFAYPPFVALALAPLASRPYNSAYLGMWLANAVFLGIALMVLGRGLDLAPEARRWLVLSAAVTFPVYFTLLQGQLSLLVLLILALHITAARAGREGRAGVWLALLSMKPQLLPIPLLLALRRRQGRLLAVAGIGATTLWGIAAALVGRAAMGEYVGVVTALGRAWNTLGVHPARMLNLRGLAVNILPRTVAEMAWLGAAAVLVTALLVTASRSRTHGRGWCWHWAAAIVAMLLVSPHLNLHDLAIQVAAIALILANAGATPSWRAVAGCFAIAVLPLGPTLLDAGTGRGAAAIAGVLVAEVVVLLYLAMRDGRGPTIRSVASFGRALHRRRRSSDVGHV